MNKYTLMARKIIVPKNQEEIITVLRGSLSAALIGLNKATVHTLFIIAKREWEKSSMKPLNDFRFIHVNDRLNYFDEIVKIFLAHLNSVLKIPLSDNEQYEIRKSAIMYYKELLENEGYEVTYKFT